MSPSVLIAKQFARPRSLRPGGKPALADCLPSNLKSWWVRKRHTNALSARQWNSLTRAFIWAAPRLPAGKNYMNGRTFVDTNVLIYAHDVDSNPNIQSPKTFCVNFGDRKSTRLNSSHVSISYAVFCL